MSSLVRLQSGNRRLAHSAREACDLDYVVLLWEKAVTEGMPLYYFNKLKNVSKVS